MGAFAVVWGINYGRSGDWVTALLFGLTLAMSILPEEIPVAFSSFMALGAARLSRAGVLTKQPQTVESLGSATVICIDKTGTITQEGMSVRQLYDGATDALIPLSDGGRPEILTETAKSVLAYARWASETDPFDPMEKAIVIAFNDSLAPTASVERVPVFPMVHEYPLAGLPPMMTHVRQSPTGKLFGMPLSMLEKSPFTNFLIPGIILFIVLGLVPCGLVIALLTKPKSVLAERVNFCSDMHWAWTGSIYVAFALIIWIQTQMAFLQAVDWLHTVYMLLAIAILFVTLLPGVRTLYRK